MMSQFRRLLRAQARGLSSGLSALRITWFRLLYDGLQIERGVRLGRGATLRVVKGGRMRIGAGTSVEAECELVAEGELDVGRGAFIGKGTIIVATERITIGDDALIAAYVVIRDHDHEMNGSRPFNRQPLTMTPVIIEGNVWIGTKATILQGVRVGASAVIGAHALVKSDVATGTVVGGVPARVIKTISRNSSGQEQG